jgi:hypothetical protein
MFPVSFVEDFFHLIVFPTLSMLLNQIHERQTGIFQSSLMYLSFS